MRNTNVFKAIIPSVIVFFFSQFIDMARIPFLGDFAGNLSQFLYPGAPMLNQIVVPISLWWLNFIMFFIFVIISIVAVVRVNSFSNQINRNLVFLIVTKYRRLTIIAGCLPLIISICFIPIAVKMGPTILFGITLPLFVKGIMCLVISIFYINIYTEKLIEYEKNIQQNMPKTG